MKVGVPIIRENVWIFDLFESEVFHFLLQFGLQVGGILSQGGIELSWMLVVIHSLAESKTKDRRLLPHASDIVRI